MKRLRFRRWTGSILFCRSRRDEPSVTGLSTTVMARFLCMPRWTPRPAACTEKPRRATPAATSWLFWKRWCRCAVPNSRFTSSSTTSPRIKPNPLLIFSSAIRACSFTSRLPILLGSTKSNSGSPKSSARSSLAASSHRSRIWRVNFVATSTPTLPTPVRSSGSTLTPLTACALTNSMRQSTSLVRSLFHGRKFLEYFAVTAPTPIVYLVPESGESAFKRRLESLGLGDVKDGFLCQTLADGPPMKLDDPCLLAAVKDLNPVVFLDTAVRFNPSEDENDGTQNAQGLARLIFELLGYGAQAVVPLHHSPKSLTSKDAGEPTL